MSTQLLKCERFAIDWRLCKGFADEQTTVSVESYVTSHARGTTNESEVRKI
jgi:hypothetical protein